MSNLTRRAIVTGGSGHIGGAVCRRLARDGLHVIVHGNRHPEQAGAVAAAITTNGGSAETVTFDIRDGEATRRCLVRLLDAGPIQVIINNAAIYRDGLMAAMPAERWRDVIDVSLNGFYNVTQPLLLPMLGTRWGRIITISSVTGVIGNKGQVNYAAAKSGLHGATRALALELASRRITVNAVAPGIIEGPITDQAFDAATIKRLVPMGRAGTPDEVAALVSFLASDEASYISGQIININGVMA
ncbi:MAG: 3-oxoacyl-ACP reductase FabG [Rhodospirillales bacterium]|nr:3-oxoacyl-ACP reductase FabG [Rhodospirillales bacterium]